MLKRILDISGALVGLVFLSPMFGVIALAVKLTSQGPVFFRQERVGQGGRLFRIYKFRSMAEGSDRKGAQVTASTDSRVTEVGAFLRKHKLDEYPQLINVLRGEMSLVGPRPEVPRYVQYYPTEFDRLCSHKPGMTHRVSILLRNEEKILAVAKDPENLYIKSVLPWKLNLYLDSLGQGGVIQDLQTIWATVTGGRQELGDLVPRLEGSEMPVVEVFNVEPYPEHIPRRQPARPVAARQFARTGTDLA